MKRISILLLSLTLPLLLATARGETDHAAGVTATQALKDLKDGAQRFSIGKCIYPHQNAARIKELVAGQKPFATILACSDSRVPVEMIFDAGFGDLFVIRVAGNVAGVEQTGTIEYGAEHLGSNLIVVLGHSKCGAVTAAVAGGHAEGSIGTLVSEIAPSVERAHTLKPTLKGNALVPTAVKENVWVGIENLIQSSPIIRERLQKGELQVVGAIYNLETNQVEWLGRHQRQRELIVAAEKAEKSDNSESTGAVEVTKDESPKAVTMAARAEAEATKAETPKDVTKSSSLAASTPASNQADENLKSQLESLRQEIAEMKAQSQEPTKSSPAKVETPTQQTQTLAANEKQTETQKDVTSTETKTPMAEKPTTTAAATESPKNQPEAEKPKKVEAEKAPATTPTTAAPKPALDLSWYGYFKLDGALDRNPSSHSNFVMWVPQQSQGANHDQFSMTANETRIGVSATGNGYKNVKVNGKLEFDLFANVSGVTIAENKPMLQLRHAFFSIENSHWKLVAGQTWDIISPLNPSTLNYAVLWGSGNTGYRRPQISVWYTTKPGHGNEITIASGLFRTIGGDLTPTFTLATAETSDGRDDGTDAAVPSVQGIVDFKHSMTAGGLVRFGLSGLYGSLKAETNVGREQKYSMWGVSGHIQISPSSKYGMSAEAYGGSNMGAYMGSILLGSRTNGLKSAGGWASLWGQVTPKTQIAGGYGLDDPKDSDISSGRNKNSCVYANVRYALVPRATVGLELSNWRTAYKNAGTTSDMRVQTSFILSF